MIREFVAFAGLQGYGELRAVTRSHIIAWRKDMEQRKLKPASRRRKLSALSSQGYRIWPRTERANSSDHPERFRLRRMEMSGRAERNTLSASLRRTARFSGP
jgi:hypothetical protein